MKAYPADDDDSTDNREVAHRVTVKQETLVAADAKCDKSIVGVEPVPQSADVIHPDVADQLEQEFGIEHPHKYDLYVADSTQ